MKQTTALHRRAGLAPLELVLALPLLLFVTALMILMGNAGVWKVRTLTNSRHAVWRTFTPRTGNGDPHPAGWPDSASMSAGGATPSPFPVDPYSPFEVVRGPLIVDSETGQWLPVKTSMLDMTTGLRKGAAHIEREFPLLAKMPPHKFNFTRHNTVLDGTRWQYHTMGIGSRRGTGNRGVRSLKLYPMDLAGRDFGLTERFLNAALAIVLNPNRPALLVLDRDPELREFHEGNIDFHPRVSTSVCSVDLVYLRKQHVLPLIDRIKGKPSPGKVQSVPERLAEAFLEMYQTQLAFVEQQLQNQTVPDPALLRLQQELNDKIDQLNQFLGTFPQ